MRVISHLAAVIVALSVGVFPVFAQGRGNGQAKKQATQTTRTKAETPKAKAHTPKATTKTEARTGKAEARAAKASAKAAARVAKADDKATRKGKGTVSTPPSTPIADVTPTTPTTQPVKNAKLEARLLKMLPPETTVQDAMAGFKNWGQFVAAVHVSNNLAIPFADLKARMTGITPGPTPGTTVQGTPMSLGQAIQSLKGGTTPDAGAPLTTTRIRNEVKKAEDAAHTDLRQTRERS